MKMKMDLDEEVCTLECRAVHFLCQFIETSKSIFQIYCIGPLLIL